MKITQRSGVPTESARGEGCATAKVAVILWMTLALAGTCSLPWTAADRAYALDASTTVMVVTDPDETHAPSISFVSSDLAGSVDEVRAQEIRVSAEGDAPLAYTWTRSVDGMPDPSFTNPGTSACSLADIVKNGDYRYTVTVADESGRSASATVRVLVSGGYERTPLVDAATGVMVSCSHYKGARLVVSLLGVGEREHGLLLAAAGGRELAYAYRLALDGVPSGVQAAVGQVDVSVPYGSEVQTFSLRAAPSEAQEVLFLPEGAGSVSVIEGFKANGRVAFEAPTLGSFGIQAEKQSDQPEGDKTEGDQPGGDQPGGGGSSEGGGDNAGGGSDAAGMAGTGDDGAGSAGKVSILPTTDSALLASTGESGGVVTAAFAVLALVVGAIACFAGARRRSFRN